MDIPARAEPEDRHAPEDAAAYAPPSGSPVPPAPPVQLSPVGGLIPLPARTTVPRLPHPQLPGEGSRTGVMDISAHVDPRLPGARELPEQLH